MSDAGFEVVSRGYDQVQVEEHLRRLDAEIRILVTDREAAVDQSASWPGSSTRRAPAPSGCAPRYARS